jgi:uncharacterized damage-inducible protein DinB
MSETTMTRNPYADDLGRRDPLIALRETPDAIRAQVERAELSAAERTYAPGKWTLRQILIHLAQVELVFQNRLRMALTKDDYVVQPFEQDDFMTIDPAATASQALGVYHGLRQFSLPAIDRAAAEHSDRRFRHPDFGELSIRWLLEWAAGHELRHWAQIVRITNDE